MKDHMIKLALQTDGNEHGGNREGLLVTLKKKKKILARLPFILGCEERREYINRVQIITVVIKGNR